MVGYVEGMNDCYLASEKEEVKRIKQANLDSYWMYNCIC